MAIKIQENTDTKLDEMAIKIQENTDRKLDEMMNLIKILIKSKNSP